MTAGKAEAIDAAEAEAIVSGIGTIDEQGLQIGCDGSGFGRWNDPDRAG